MSYCTYSEWTQPQIRPFISPCTDLKPWSPDPAAKLFLNAQPPALGTIGAPRPLNVTYFQFQTSIPNK